jgi:hypothetical protein
MHAGTSLQPYAGHTTAGIVIREVNGLRDREDGRWQLRRICTPAVRLHTGNRQTGGYLRMGPFNREHRNHAAGDLGRKGLLRVRAPATGNAQPGCGVALVRRLRAGGKVMASRHKVHRASGGAVAGALGCRDWSDLSTCQRERQDKGWSESFNGAPTYEHGRARYHQEDRL